MSLAALAYDRPELVRRLAVTAAALAAVAFIGTILLSGFALPLLPLGPQTIVIATVVAIASWPSGGDGRTTRRDAIAVALSPRA